MNLEDVIRVFHESDGCSGIITSNERGWLECAECGKGVGRVDPGVLASLITALERFVSA
jgi:hypothetical protein